jgi:hypothetical protein
MTLAAKNKTMIVDFKMQLNKHVKFTDGGEINWLLGIQIKRDRQMYYQLKPTALY